MEDIENIAAKNMKILMNSLQKEQNFLNTYLQKSLEIKKSLENAIDADDKILSNLNDVTRKLEAENAIKEFKLEKLEKEAKELESKNDFLRKSIETSQVKSNSYKEKSISEIENFQNEAINLCELFGSAIFTYSEKSTKQEIEKIHKDIIGKRNEYEEITSQLNAAKNELDDIVLYQAPQNKQEIEIPLGQRKMILSLFEDALFKAENRLEQVKNMKVCKESEFENV